MKKIPSDNFEENPKGRMLWKAITNRRLDIIDMSNI